MKEIIYLDTEIVNSLLAQLDQGVTNEFTVEENNSVSHSSTTSTNLGTDAGIEGGIKLGTGFIPGGGVHLKFKNGGRENEGEISSLEVIEGQKDLLNKQFHDYSLDILLQKLSIEGLIKDTKNNEEGDLIQSEGVFDFYDFSLINKATDPDTWKEIMSWEDYESEHNFTEAAAKKIYNKVKAGKSLTSKEDEIKNEALIAYETIVERENITKVIKMLETFSSTTNRLFKDLTFVKTEDLVGLLKKKYLRESTEALSFRGKNTRKAKFLGRVIGEKDELYDGSEFDFSPNEINKIPNILLDLLLGSFNILRVGDILITPIAVYYESN